MTEIEEKLARFGHHPDPEIDWAIECEELENIVSNFHLGLTGFGHEQEYERLGKRLSKFLDYGTLDPHVLEMKRVLREHISRLGYLMSPKWYEGAPVHLFRAKGQPHAK
jgi:hypothetical protein